MAKITHTCICGKCITPKTYYIDDRFIEALKNIRYDFDVKLMANQAMDKHFEGEQYE